VQTACANLKGWRFDKASLFIEHSPATYPGDRYLVFVLNQIKLNPVFKFNSRLNSIGAMIDSGRFSC